MYNLDTGQYTDEQICDFLATDREVWYEYDLLDKNNIPMGQVTATGSIDYNSTVKIQRTAQLEIREERDINFLTDKVKPSMCLRTPKGIEKFPLGVFFMNSPERQAVVGGVARGIECYDTTLQLKDDKFTTRHTIAAGTNYVTAIQSILNSAGITDARITSTAKTLAVAIDFPLGTSKLDAVNQLLTAINYNPIYADQNGRLMCEPYEDPLFRAPQASYITGAKSIIFSGVKEELDAYNIPNKVVRYLDSADRAEIISTVVNDDPENPLSTVARGRTIVDIASVNDIADQNTLDSYAARVMDRYKAYQRVILETGVMPNHGNMDCIYIVDKELNLSGKYIEEAWNISLTLGGHMSHTLRKVNNL